MNRAASTGVYIAVIIAGFVVAAIANVLAGPMVERAWVAELSNAYGGSMVRIGDDVETDDPDILECRRVLDGRGTTIGIVAFTRVRGYRAPVELVVAVDATGNVHGVLPQSSMDLPFVDASSGATTTRTAVDRGVAAVRRVAMNLESGPGQ